MVNLTVKIDDLIRHQKARELRFDKNNISLFFGFENYDNSIPTNSRSIINLLYKSKVTAIVGFEISDNFIEIEQIQGRKCKRCYKPLASINWERYLIRSVIEFGRTLEEINQVLSKDSLAQIYESYNYMDAERATKRYDLPCIQEGFSYDKKRKLFVRNI